MANRIYSAPAAYDLAFSYRDYEGEVAVMTDWYRTIAGVDRPPTSVLELACGPARYLHEFARHGARCVGIDTSEPMCRYANSLVHGSDLNLSVGIADMTAFELDEKFALVLLMLNSLSHILDEASLTGHFGVVADHLTDDGVYIVEASRIAAADPFGESTWKQSDARGSVSVRWCSRARREIGRIVGTVNGEAVDVSDEFPMRHWRTEELILAAQQAGLALTGHYGDFSPDWADVLAGNEKLEGNSELRTCFVFSRQPTK